MPLLKKEYHSYIYIFGLILLAASLTLSQILMSIAEFILVFNWLAEGNFREKYLRLTKNNAVLGYLLIFMLHVAGLFYTHNFSFAMDDIRIKLPLLALPVIIATTPYISRKVLFTILLVHITATFSASVVGVVIFFTQQIDDMRDISILISHIRFSLNICLDIFILMFFLFSVNQYKYYHKIGFVFLIAWFVYFLLFMESFTGIIILALVGVILILGYMIKKTPRIYKFIFLAFLIVSGFGTYYYLKNIYNNYHNNIETIDFNKLENYTRHGGLYVHDIKNKMTDNGFYTWMYVCDKELEMSWNNRSKINFNSTDKQNQPLRFTLIRYLSSKGLRKDMDGVNSLSDSEIKLIENGIANVEYTKKGSFRKRIKNAIWEYENYKITHDPRGQSAMQRFELWKVSLDLIKNHTWFGVGTGDPYDAITEALYLNNSVLKDTGLRSHNQFLTITIAFGIIGLMIFLFGLIYPAIEQKKFSDFLFLAFFLIAFLSMLTEDTLESQAGVTFFAFFSCLFLFAYKKNIPEQK